MIGEDVDRREWAMTMLLAARAIERIGDNAVDIGEQVAFVVTGLFREFEDASHPPGPWGIEAKPQPSPSARAGRATERAGFARFALGAGPSASSEIMI